MYWIGYFNLDWFGDLVIKLFFFENFIDVMIVVVFGDGMLLYFVCYWFKKFKEEGVSVVVINDVYKWVMCICRCIYGK